MREEELLFNLAERDKTQNGPQSFKNTLKSASQLIDEAYKRGKGLPGVDTGFSGLNRFFSGSDHPSEYLPKSISTFAIYSY